MQCVCSLAAAIVELNTLADAVWPAAEDHDLVCSGGPGFILGLVGTVKVRGAGCKLRGTSIHAMKSGQNTPGFANLTNLASRQPRQAADVRVGKPHTLGAAQQGDEFFRLWIACSDSRFEVNDFLQLRQKPGVVSAGQTDFIDRFFTTQRTIDLEQPVGRCNAQI